MTPELLELAHLIRGRDRLVWLTGAGLSVASGVPTYRRGEGAIWDRFVTDWGTVERFQQDSRAWWREFWLKAHPSITATRQPNAGHRAITEMVRARPRHVVITQNIDGLHRKAGLGEEQLIEIHGTLGKYRCLRPHCVQWRKEIVMEVDEAALARPDAAVPTCPSCQTPVLPLVLLFDEAYAIHPFFQFRRAQHLLEQAEGVVFVGTSFSVGITAIAVQSARMSGAPLYNFNLHAEDGMVNILGPAEQTLVELQAAVQNG